MRAGAVLREFWRYGPGDAERALFSQNPCASTGVWYLEPSPMVRLPLDAIRMSLCISWHAVPAERPAPDANHASAGGLQAWRGLPTGGCLLQLQAIRFMGAMRDRLLDPATRFQWDQVRLRGSSHEWAAGSPFTSAAVATAAAAGQLFLSGTQPQTLPAPSHSCPCHSPARPRGTK